MGFDPAVSPLRVLIVANRTAATPDLMAAVRRCAQQRPTVFALLIPGARAEHPDWTPELALALVERAAGGRVAGLPATHRNPFAAVRDAVAATASDRIIVSTLPSRASRWLRRDLAKRLEKLEVPFDVITPQREKWSDITGPPLLSGCELWLKTRS
jgi:hypothetical protein